MAKKKRKRKPVVRGPQMKLRLGRTPRLRFIEPPHKASGNPFVAFRAPRALYAAFGRWCRERKTTMPLAFRAYMSKVTGVAEVGQDAE